jgi:hypothetical protein
VRLIDQAESIIADYVTTSARLALYDENFQRIIAAWEAVKSRGEYLCASGNTKELERYHFFLDECLSALKSAYLKLQFLTIDTTDFSDTIGINVGIREQHRIRGGVYAFLFEWLHRMIHTVPTHYCVIDNKIITDLIRTLAKQSLKWWQFTWKQRLANKAFAVDLFAGEPLLAHEYLVFLNEYEKRNATTIETLLTATKSLLGHSARTIMEIKQKSPKEQFLPHVQTIQTLMAITTHAYQTLIREQEMQKLATEHQCATSDTEQAVHKLVSDVYSGNWLSKLQSKILQPIMKKVAPSILQMLLDNLKSPVDQKGTTTSTESFT